MAIENISRSISTKVTCMWLGWVLTHNPAARFAADCSSDFYNYPVFFFNVEENVLSDMTLQYNLNHLSGTWP